MDTESIRQCVRCYKPIPSVRRADALYCSNACRRAAQRSRKNPTGDGDGLKDLARHITKLAEESVGLDDEEKVVQVGSTMVDLLLIALPQFANRMAKESASASDVSALMALMKTLPEIKENLMATGTKEVMPNLLNVVFVEPGANCPNCGELLPV